jgi:hypothetical protein
MALGNPNFDSLLSTTLDNYRKTLTDNIFKARVLLWWLTEKNRVTKKSGGVTIVEPLLIAEGQAGSYGEWDAISIVPQEGISAAQFPWRQLFATIAISGLEEAQNNGEEEIISLLDAKVTQAEETLKNKLSGMCYADGTGNSGKDFQGLALLVNNTGIVGGIDSAAAENSWWRSYVGTATGAIADKTLLQPAMTTAYNTVSNGNDVVDGIFAAQGVYELYESTLTPNVRYSDTKSVNAGFSNLMFKQCPMYWDRGTPVGVMYGLNSKYIGLVGHTDRWMKQSPFTESMVGPMSAAAGGNASTVDARYSIITAYGNMTVRNRGMHFKLTVT